MSCRTDQPMTRPHARPPRVAVAIDGVRDGEAKRGSADWRMETSMPVRVLIVDDSAFMRRAISRLLGADPEIRVVGSAANGQEGIDKVKELSPDVVMLDMEMPVLDGTGTLRRLRAELGDTGPAVLIFSGQTSEGSHTALQAMRLGAADVVSKPGGASGTAGELPADLLGRIKAVASSRRRTGSKREASSTAGLAALRLETALLDVVVIGSSTGGPPVLEEICTSLPPDLRVPVVIAQHMPPLFTLSLAQRLNDLCAVSIVHAEPGMPLHPGTVYIAPGGKHARVVRIAAGRYGLEVSDRPVEALYKPSVNELFASAARAMGSRCLAVILTGMGDDGLEGAKEIRAKGGAIIAQDAASCVVYGMPRAVADAGLASASAPPKQIAAALALLRARGTGAPPAAPPVVGPSPGPVPGQSRRSA